MCGAENVVRPQVNFLSRLYIGLVIRSCALKDVKTKVRLKVIFHIKK